MQCCCKAAGQRTGPQDQDAVLIRRALALVRRSVGLLRSSRAQHWSNGPGPGRSTGVLTPGRSTTAQQQGEALVQRTRVFTHQSKGPQDCFTVVLVPQDCYIAAGRSTNPKDQGEALAEGQDASTNPQDQYQRPLNQYFVIDL